MLDWFVFCPRQDVVWLMVKLPDAPVQPVPPLSDQVPVAAPPESVVPLIVPVTVLLVKVRVLAFPTTVNVMLPVTASVAMFSVRSIDPLTVPPLESGSMGKQLLMLRN